MTSSTGGGSGGGHAILLAAADTTSCGPVADLPQLSKEARAITNVARRVLFEVRCLPQHLVACPVIIARVCLQAVV